MRMAQGAEMGEFYVDATSMVLRPFHQKTGVERVEQELCDRLVYRGAKLVWFDVSVGKFRLVSRALLALLEEVDDLKLEQLLEQVSTVPRHTHRARRAAALTFSALYSHMPRKFGLQWHTERLALRYFASAHSSMLPAERNTFAQHMRLSNQSPLLRKLAIQLVDKSNWSAASGSPIVLMGDDVLLSCRIWLSNAQRDLLKQASQQLGLKYVHLIYDLIPIRHPEFVADTRYGVEFERFLNSTIHSARILPTISHFVARDLESYCSERRLPRPRIVPIPLATQTVTANATLTPRLAAIPTSGSGFALMVGTFQPRKNQAWLHKLWQGVVANLGQSAPALVFAGQLGWGYEETIRNLRTDTALWNRKVFLVEAPSDEELVWLYEHCKFALLPSKYEGFGLPVGEALAFGKYCLTSDCTAIPEVAGDLTFSAPLSKPDVWIAEITRLSRDPQYFAACSARLKSAPPMRSWGDVADDMLHLCTSES